MATIDVKDAAGNTVAIEKPLVPNRAAANASRPVVVCDDDKAALDKIATTSPPTLGAAVDLAFNATSAQSAAITGTLIRVAAKGANCRIATGSNPTAAASGTLLFAGIPEYFTITTGHKVAAIRDAATDGSLNITVVA